MKLPAVRLPALPDVDDLHIYGGLAALAAGAALFHPGLGLLVLGAGLVALGAIYALASAQEAKANPERPGHFEALRTAAETADDEAA